MNVTKSLKYKEMFMEKHVSQRPRVSIGMPVYNGANYLAPTLDALLAQTYPDFELVISDNGSTDETAAICRDYAARDSRIHYHRYETNRGAAWNYNNVFDLCQGEYFKWAAHDDHCAPEFLERCVAVLDSHPEVVLAYPRTKAIDDNGDIIREYPAKPAGIAQQPHKRFYEFVCIAHPCVAVFGLIRREVLAKTPRIGNYSSADRPLLGELSLHGKLYEIPEYLFFYRNHAQQSWREYATKRAVLAWYDPNRKHKLAFPQWRLLKEHLDSIQRVPLSAYERLQCYLCMGWWMRKRWRKLAKSLILQEV